MNEESYIEYPKSVRLTKEQKEWIEKNSINFSDWVRQRIDERMCKKESDMCAKT